MPVRKDAQRLFTRDASTITLALWIGFVSLGRPTDTCCAQTATAAGVELSTIDASTRWAFRSRATVTVSSAIIRLGDVIEPVDPNLGAWQRLRHAPIGLVPIDGQPTTVQRDRLDRIILQAEATPHLIDWIGPRDIRVVYRESDETTGPAFPANSINTVGYLDDSSGPADRQAMTSHTAAYPTLSASDADRVVYWIELALDRLQKSVAETYHIEIDRRQAGLAPLQGIVGVTSLQAIEPVHEGTCRFHVVGRSVAGSVESEINVTLTAHPQVVVPRKNFGRGHRIELSDLVLRSFPEDELQPGHYVDVESVVGLEVRSSLRSGRPINHGDVGSPILVHRGDLVEIRVVGGGVRVTTNAKALGDGAVSDLIEIEILQPRKRLVARVAAPGLVEIITRAPRVTP